MTTLANASKVDDFVKEITETSKTYMEVVGEPMKKSFDSLKAVQVKEL